MPKVSVILLNMGGPRNGDEVRPFLEAMFADPDLIQMPLKPLLAPLIVRMRTPSARRRYGRLEGGSPLLDICREQARALEEVLEETDPGVYRVRVGMRYTAPTVAEAVDDGLGEGCERFIGLSLYPQYCRATTGSSIAEIERVMAARGSPPLDIVDRYFDVPGYLDALASSVKETMPAGRESTVLFSAHGVPLRMVKEGDPYVAETERTAAEVASRLDLGKGRWRLAYQSRVGPVRWVGPSSERAVDELAAAGCESLVIVPISFTAENLETLYDIDIELAARARGAGISLVSRSPALNADLDFMNVLASLVRETG